MKPLVVGLFLILGAIAFAAPPRNVAAAVPVPLRCNEQVAGELEAQVRDLERHPPSDADVDNGIGRLQSLLSQLAREDGVLEATCGSESPALVPLRADIRAAEARAYVAEADLTLRHFAKCPAGREQIAAGYLAAAWLSLARAVPDSGVMPQVAKDVVPEVTSRAAVAALTLPSVANTSSYWLTTVQAAGKQAADRCQQ